jgi:hypothetical protein
MRAATAIVARSAMMRLASTVFFELEPFRHRAGRSARRFAYAATRRVA